MSLNSAFWNSGYTGVKVMPDFTAATVNYTAIGSQNTRVDIDNFGLCVCMGGKGTDSFARAGDEINGYHWGHDNTVMKWIQWSFGVGISGPFDYVYYAKEGRQLYVPVSNLISLYTNNGYFPFDLHMWQPESYLGRPARVIASIILHKLTDGDYSLIDTSSFSNADDFESKFGIYALEPDLALEVLYRREPSQPIFETLKALARHSFCYLTVNMAGKLAYIPRYDHDPIDPVAYDPPGLYNIKGLDAGDGVITAEWRYAPEHLSNRAICGFGRWHGAFATSAVHNPSYYMDVFALPQPLGCGEESNTWSGSLWAEFENAGSINKHGENTVSNLKASFYIDNIKSETDVLHLPYLSTTDATTATASLPQARNAYMARLDVDAVLRREVRAVQDMRGLDYDCGWAVEDVEVTADGHTIPSTRCIRKMINFRDMTVTSTLLEEPAFAEKSLMKGPPGATYTIKDINSINPAFGGVDDYTEFEPDGTLRMNGEATVYMDIVCPVIVRATGTNRPGLQTFIGNILQYQFDVGDYAEIEAVELPHSWKEGSELEIHVHWATGGLNDATARAVKWEIEYAYAGRDNLTYTGTATDSAETVIPANTADRTLFYTQIDTFVPTGFGIGTQLVMRLRRIAADGTAPAADPFVLDIGVHYEMDTLGSRNRATK